MTDTNRNGDTILRRVSLIIPIVATIMIAAMVLGQDRSKIQNNKEQIEKNILKVERVALTQARLEQHLLDIDEKLARILDSLEDHTRE